VREAVPTVWAVRSESDGGDQTKGDGRLRAALFLSAAVRSPELWLARARVAPGHRSWVERKKVPRRTRWRGKGHESTDREGRTTVRKPRAGRRNSGEPFRPRGGDLRRAKAWASFSRGRGDTGTYSGELDRANRPTTARARRTATAEHRRRRKWPNIGRNRGKWARGRVSHLGADLGEAWSGL
jgi:hypothetical protein